MKEKVEELLGLSTGITSIEVLLEEVRGSRYVFSGFNPKLWPQQQYFFWNCITQSCDRITSPLGKDNIIEQIKKDVTKVTVEEYDDEEDALEDAEEDAEEDGEEDGEKDAEEDAEKDAEEDALEDAKEDGAEYAEEDGT